jgi:histidinol dehydrogenase
MIRILESSQVGDLLSRKAVRLAQAEEAVRPILEAVRTRGDDAVLEYARKFDGFDRETTVVASEELTAARASLTAEFRNAVQTAAENIRAYARLQMPQAKQTEVAPGICAGQIVRPLEVVAAYIPAGRYPLPSTLMMTAIPAQVAGVRTICVTSPKPVPEVLGTAAMLEVDRVFLMGGAHAIAAFAFGTATVPKADRIVGPGNIYVAAAKKLLAGEVGIDFIAGPTEILMIADDGNPAWLAADMLAQAEHDTDASAVLLTSSRKLAESVAAQIETRIATLPTGATARAAIDRNSAIVLVRSREEAIELSNRFAPEHLSVPDESYLDGIHHAGSIFIGPTSPEAAGDYASGPNHVLPTSGAARLRGGLSAADFVKIISTQQVSRDGLKRLLPAITTLARAEGLEAHARSVEVRFDG